MWDWFAGLSPADQTEWMSYWQRFDGRPNVITQNLVKTLPPGRGPDEWDNPNIDDQWVYWLPDNSGDGRHVLSHNFHRFLQHRWEEFMEDPG